MSDIDRAKLIEISAKVRDHLTFQQEQSADVDGDCLYRSETGAMCAVGCLINDANYSKALEQNVVDNDHVWNAVSTSLDIDPASATGEGLLLILRQWQLYHDGIEHFDATGLRHEAYPFWIESKDFECSPAAFEQRVIVPMIEDDNRL